MQRTRYLATIPRNSANMVEQIQIPYNDHIGILEYMNKHTNDNVYATPNSFKPNAPRQLENVIGIHEIYIDIDYKLHNQDWQEKQDFIKHLENTAFNNTVPRPSRIVNSGRGIYLVYSLRKIEDNTLSYRMITKRIMELLEPIIADYSQFIAVDKKCQDAGRYFRVNGSINTKNNRYVTTLKEYKEKYTFNDFFNLESFKQVSRFSMELVKENSAEWKQYHGYSLAQLYHNRIIDLNTIQSLRNARNVKEGYRNTFLSIYVNTLLIEKFKTEEIYETIYDINRNFKEPLSSNEVKHIVLSALRRKYKFTNQTIIDKLELSASERKHLKVFITDEERYKRRDSLRSLNRAIKRKKKQIDYLTAIKSLKSQGASNRFIAKELNCAESTVRNYIKRYF